MLRFLILRNAGDAVFKDGKIQNAEEAGKWIGTHSFMVNATNCKDKGFGKITGLSHVKVRRVVDGQSIDLDFAPLYKEIDFSNSSLGTYNLNDFCIPDIDDYKAKDGLPTLLTDGVKTYKLDEIFKEDRRMGIERNINTGKTEDNALFKQISYRFSDKSHYCFVFDVEVADDLNLEDKKYNGKMVSVGADNSQFIISISDTIVTNPDIKPVNNAVYLLSPAFLTLEDVHLAKFAITNLVSFRFLKSTVGNDPDSYRITKGGLVRSERYELYAPGSVFYFEGEDQKQQFISRIESKQEFRQIGYNEYK